METSSSASCLRGNKIGSITIDGENHVAGLVNLFGVGESCSIVKEVQHGLDGLLGAISLSGSEVVEGMEHCVINSTSIIQEFPTDLLKVEFVGACHGFRAVFWSELYFLAKFWWDVFGGRVERFERVVMLEL